MKLLAPVRSADEVEMLVQNGADELFCGFTPPEWAHRFGGLQWLNRRSPAGGNAQSWEDLQAILDAAHGLGVPVFLTLNGVSFTREQAAFQVELAHEARQRGVDAFIVADVGLLLELAESGLEAPFHISTLGSAFNHRSVRFYAGLGARRVVLPRQLSLAEIEEMAAQVRGGSRGDARSAPLDQMVPEVDLEVFVLNDGCYYDEGSCSTSHSLGPFCLQSGEFRFNRGDYGEALADYGRQLWANNNCGSKPSSRGLPLGPCALCHLPRLARAGVKAAKIAGREAGSLRKLASVQLASAVLRRMRAGLSDEEVRRQTIELRGEPELCRSGLTCLYR